MLLRELGVLRFAVPERRRLVPEHVTTRGPVVGPIQFGFEMGTGMRTYSPSALPHLLLLAVLLVLTPPWAFLAALGLAAGRWVMAGISNAYADDGSWSDRWAEHRRVLAGLTTAPAVLCLLILAGSRLW